MRVFRIILSLLFLLAAVAIGVVTYVAATNEKLKDHEYVVSEFLPAAAIEAVPALDVSIKLFHLLGGFGVVVLLIAGSLWPPYVSKWQRTPKKKDKGALAMPADDENVSSQLDWIPKSSGTAHNLPAMELEELTDELDASEPETQNDLDEDELRELINMEQQTLDKDAASKIINQAYSHLAPLIPNFYDEASLVTLARQIIAVLRFRVKLKDKSLSSYQFSQFEDRAYKAEEERILYRYSPKNMAELNDYQKELEGKIFAQTSYRKVQQKLRAERDDWEYLSVKELC